MKDRDAAAGERLRGRERELDAVASDLRLNRSVLLVGPASIGKSAIARAVTSPGVILLDPFERVGRLDAGRLRQRLDRGHVALATARERSVRDIGAVGRVLWRFHTIVVPPLAAISIRQILVDVFSESRTRPGVMPSAWWTEAIAAADGRPGLAVLIARVTVRSLARTGRWPTPGLIVIDHRIDGAVRWTRPRSKTRS